ncbi:MAG: phosphoribosylanthranilate isomerase [bacterium]|nr:phosphoribosylanthranilate isomerase [bacterium]
MRALGVVKVKICGLKTQEAVEAAILYGADFIGLVHFPKSLRHVSLVEAGKLADLARGHVKIVLLLVNPDHALIDEATRRVSPDYIQLHGGESLEDVCSIRTRGNLPVIKAIAVETADDVAGAASYGKVADMLLFDAKPSRDTLLPGGNGIPFDWSALKGFNSDKEYMLSGGLDPQTVAQAIRETGATIVDVSSGVESAPGIKDLEKIKTFIAQAKK